MDVHFFLVTILAANKLHVLKTSQQDQMDWLMLSPMSPNLEGLTVLSPLKQNLKPVTQELSGQDCEVCSLADACLPLKEGGLR